MDNCPKCKGKPIAIDGGWMGIYDGIVACVCTKCGHQFPRSEEEYDKTLFERYKIYMEENGEDKAKNTQQDGTSGRPDKNTEE